MTNDHDDAAGRELELVFGLAGPAGADLREVGRTLGDALRTSDYAVEEIDVGQLIRQIAARRRLTRADGSSITLHTTPEELRISSHMDAGNAVRRLCESAATAASLAMADIVGRRKRAGGRPGRRAYVIRSLKRPEEANLLRRVYGPGFFLIGVNESRPARIESLAKRIAASHHETPASPRYAHYVAQAEAIAMRDEAEERDPYGQRLRDVFQLCDLFVAPGPSLFPHIDRFVRLILGDLGETPWPDEQFLHQAAAASLSSGALGRQVGAVLVSPAREVLGIGWNDVPKAGGGLYRSGDHYDRRDIREQRDSVNVHADQIVEEILDVAADAGWLAGSKPTLAEARKAFRKSRITSLIEFGRTAHAEMEAVGAAARIGVSVRGATLYTTTFPCHECARLIVTAGIRRVVYIEPYPKSRALELHRDAIHGYDDAHAPACDARDCDEIHAVRFEPFVGIGPHRYAELFSITTRAGVARDRKTRDSGERIPWNPKTALPRIEMLPLSYLDLEAKALYQLKKKLGPK